MKRFMKQNEFTDFMKQIEKQNEKSFCLQPVAQKENLERAGKKNKEISHRIIYRVSFPELQGPCAVTFQISSTKRNKREPRKWT